MSRRRPTCAGRPARAFAAALAAVLAAGLAPPSPALAGAAGTGIAVSASVEPQCWALSAAFLAFGSYVPDRDTEASAAFSVQCSVGTPVTVSLGAGQGPGATPALRRLTDGRGHSLDYLLYASSAATRPWGDGTAGTATVSATGLGLDKPLSFTVYGRIPAGQTGAVAGTYTDTITITVSY